MSEGDGQTARPASAPPLLDASESGLADVFDHSAIGMALVSPEGTWLKVNRRIPEIVGYTEDELIGKPFADITHPDDVSADVEIVQRMVGGDFATHELEKRFLHRDGATVWAHLAVSLLRDGHGRPRHFLVQINDITARRQAAARAAQHQRRLDEIHRVASVAGSSLDLDVVFERILERTTRAVNATAGMIFLKDAASGLLRWGASLGLSDRFVEAFTTDPVRLGEGLTGTIAATGAPIFILNAASQDPRVARQIIREEGFESFIGVPLDVEGEVIGVMTILTRPPDRLVEEDVAFCAAVGSQVGLAIRHAQAFAEQRSTEANLRDSNRRLQSFLQISQTIAAAPDHVSLMQAIVDGATAAVGLSTGAVYLRTDRDTIELAATNPPLTADFPEAFRRASLEDHPHIGKTLTTGQPVIMPDSGVARLTAAERAVVELKNLRANLYLPILLDGEAIGVLIVSSAEPGHVFDADQVAFLQGFANQAAQVSRNVRNFEQATRHARQLEEEVAERSRVTQELRESEARLRSYLANSPYGVFVVDRDGRFRDVNPAATSISGYAESTLLSMSIADILAPESLDAGLDHFREVVTTGLAAGRELAYRHASGETRYWRVSAAKVSDDRFIGFAEDTTDVRAAQAEIRRFKTIADTAPYGMAISDLDGRFLYVNPFFARIHGYEPDELLGRHLSVFHKPEQLAAVAETLAAGRAQGSFAPMTIWHVDRDGTEFPMLMSGVVIKDEDGTPQCLAASAIDMTAHHRAEQEYQTLFREAMNGFAVHEIICDANGEPVDYRFLAVNPAFERLTGLKAEQVVGRTVREVLPGIEPRWIETYGSVALTGEPAVFEDHVAQIGKHFEISAYRPAPGQFACLFQDVTARKHAEEAVAASEQRYRTLFENMNAGFVLFEVVEDEAGRPVDLIVLAANARWGGTTGVGIETAVGRRLTDILPGIERDEADWIGTYGRIALTGEPMQFERGSTLLGTHFSVAAFPAGPKQCAVTFVDISDRKRAEAERDRAQTQLVQAQKMESVGRLAGGVAHDFNNMLAVILGHTEMAMERLGPDDPLHADLEEVRKAAQRSADLTRQLLAFARKQTIAPAVLDVNATIGGMLRMLQRLIGENIDLVWRPSADVWPVRMDPAQVDQILANLCVNARDAIAAVGTIVIETSNVSLDESQCTQLDAGPPGDYVHLAVSDNGCGMEPELVARIFEPFFTTKDVGQGTGLGLATVYGVVKQNQGFVSVYSEPGHGTTFKIFLPRHVSQAAPGPATVRPSATEPGSETVLVVEDEPAILQMTTRMLEGLGYTVLAAATPGDAMRLAREHAGAIDLLLTDVIMPEMSGRDLARHLLSIHPDLARLFMSGYPAGAFAHQEVLEAGVYFLQKPFALTELSARVRQALEGRARGAAEVH